MGTSEPWELGKDTGARRIYGMLRSSSCPFSCYTLPYGQSCSLPSTLVLAWCADQCVRPRLRANPESQGVLFRGDEVIPMRLLHLLSTMIAGAFEGLLLSELLSFFLVLYAHASGTKLYSFGTQNATTLCLNGCVLSLVVCRFLDSSSAFLIS